ncbi:MAG TPA: hypothetical protein VLT33_44595 [Labilithrix sp.]|nr:hypothetical protein [Labilithrix sp.]
MRSGLLVLGVLVVAACSRPASPGADLSREGGPGPAALVAEAGPSMAPPAASGPALPAGAVACPTVAAGPACVRFASVEDAFRWVLAHEPVILAVGEAHAQKGTEGIPSATRRFTEALLPVLENRASDVLVEAWAGDPKCQREVKAVASAQRPVQQAQAQTNPNEYLTLGNRAKALGMVPDLLRPTCDDYANLADAGADTITASLELIKRLTQAQALRLFQRNQGLNNGKVVVTYGGAMHNDLAPAEALRKYSFGPELAQATTNRYVELDLIVPEYVKKTESWEKLPWFAAWQADAAPKDKPTLYRLGDRSFTLIFAATPPVH